MTYDTQKAGSQIWPLFYTASCSLWSVYAVAAVDGGGGATNCCAAVLFSLLAAASAFLLQIDRSPMIQSLCRVRCAIPFYILSIICNKSVVLWGGYARTCDHRTCACTCVSPLCVCDLVRGHARGHARACKINLLRSASIRDLDHNIYAMYVAIMRSCDDHHAGRCGGIANVSKKDIITPSMNAACSILYIYDTIILWHNLRSVYIRLLSNILQYKIQQQSCIIYI